MCIHTTLAIGYPEKHFNSNIEYALIGALKAFCIVAVNIFVIISGYFGIKCTVKRLLKFLFQIVFFSIIGYVISIVCNVQSFNLKTFMSEGFILGPKTYWFVQSYLILFIVSPILNAACEILSREQLKKFLLVFFIVQCGLGWLFATLNSEIRGGLSSVSFLGIYMLMRYVKLYSPNFSLKNKSSYFLSYIYCSLFIAILAYIGVGGLMINQFSYVSPLVLVSSLSLFFFFLKMNLSIRFVNTVAASCFSVYLLHEQISISKTLYRPFINNVYTSASSMLTGALDVFIIMIAVYLSAIVLDKGRILLYNVLSQLTQSIYIKIKANVRR